MLPTNSHVLTWAKTTKDGRPGITVSEHGLNVGYVAEALITALPPTVQELLPAGAITLAALHDVGKITLGFQAKCPLWLAQPGAPKASPSEIALTVTDHALVSQVFLQKILPPIARLWAVAVGSHHGRVKGRYARIPQGTPELHADWAETHRKQTAQALCAVFGDMPATPPNAGYAPYHTDLWLLAGLITVADWIASNEIWFPPDHGLTPEKARQQAQVALTQIGWPGSTLKTTDFTVAFASGNSTFTPNAIQQAVATPPQAPSIIIIEGPMGCGKTEAALFAAQQLIASGANHGLYFALPTQITSNRIHRRISAFLRKTLAGSAPLRLAHSNAWLEDDFNFRIRPASPDAGESVQDARCWFASPKRALLTTYGVGTIDQALQGVVAVKHFFVRRFALAGKVVILDEVHSYDIYTGTLVTALIRELVNLQCSIIILSATLTAARRRELLAAAGINETETPTAYPLVTLSDGNQCQHFTPAWNSNPPIKLRTAVIPVNETCAELLHRATAGQHVLWIRNTVVEAQQAFRTIRDANVNATVRVGLLHSRFPFQRRSELEDDWLEILGKNRPTSGPGTILIATQVVEQSVDIDLDFIVSDLAPTDMLLQRLGRLWRHDRPQRATSTPEFWVRLPELPTESNGALLKRALGRSARVYAPYVLLRTMAVWKPIATLQLPADIRPLLEATYADLNDNDPAVWRELHEELEKEKATLAANAEAATRVLGNPLLADKEEIHTRREGPTVPIVLLRSITELNGTANLVALDGSSIEISEHE